MTYFACEKFSRSENIYTCTAEEGCTNKTNLHASAKLEVDSDGCSTKFISLVSYYSQICLCLQSHLLFLKLC